LAADLETYGQGRFEAVELGEGDYRLEISKPNFLPASLRISLKGRDGVVKAPIRIVRMGAITGRVVDQGGKPVTGATAFALSKPPAGQPLRPRLDTGRHASVDPSGRYRLTDALRPMRTSCCGPLPSYRKQSWRRRWSPAKRTRPGSGYRATSSPVNGMFWQQRERWTQAPNIGALWRARQSAAQVDVGDHKTVSVTAPVIAPGE
jgi:hypothetical protein